MRNQTNHAEHTNPGARMNKAITDIRGMDTAELQAKLQDLHKEQFGLKFHSAPEQVARTSRHREIRRTIARITMVLGERASGATAVASAPVAKKGKASAGAGKRPAGKPPVEKAPVEKAPVEKAPVEKAKASGGKASAGKPPAAKSEGAKKAGKQ